MLGLGGRKFVLAVIIVANAVVIAMGQATDRTTGLPLHSGLTFQQSAPGGFCQSKAQQSLYVVPDDADLAEYTAWYKGQLKDFRWIERNWDGRPYQFFYSPDGTLGVTVKGSKTAGNVYSVSYYKFTPGLSRHQMEAFAPDNPLCK